MRTVAAAVAALVLCMAASSAENYVSNTYGFSANFPGIVQAGVPQASEADAKGHAVSTIVTIKSESIGTYTAMVTVELYNKAVPVDASSARTMINVFAAQLDATVTSSKPVALEGAKGRSFTYQSRDKNAKGAGMVVIAGGKKPRVYQVFTMYTSSASADDIAALDAFLKSFQLD
jgi:hypothetical protein